ncbi:MAG: Crp/Fnr family transcriptional regulator [Anaerolineales bacterium]|nr:Crp/Fnr family transcriptional regulator [Anaerolineales bacterium]
MDISPDALKQVVALQSATDDDLHLIYKNSVVRSVEEDGYFFMQGDEAAYSYVLASGQVKLMQSNPQGQQVNLRTISPWQMYGAIGAVRKDNPVYPVTAQAMENSAALAIPNSFFRSALEERPYLAFGIMNQMTSYIQEIQIRYRELATEKVEQRVANTLVRLAGQLGVRATDEVKIELAFSRQDVAEMSGTTLYTVSRLLSEWERRGVIKAGREKIIVVKPHELVRIADGKA